MIAIAALLALSSATHAWIVNTQTNLMGQPEAIAELPEAAAGPGRYLKFSCSVMSGPVFETGLGQRSFEEFTRFSADDAARERSIDLTIAPDGGGSISVAAIPAASQVTAYAFVVEGSDAMRAAQAVASAKRVSIVAPDVNAQFDAPDAASAIGHVLDACPFKG